MKVENKSLNGCTYTHKGPTAMARHEATCKRQTETESWPALVRDEDGTWKYPIVFNTTRLHEAEGQSSLFMKAIGAWYQNVSTYLALRAVFVGTRGNEPRLVDHLTILSKTSIVRSMLFIWVPDHDPDRWTIYKVIINYIPYI